MLNLPRFATRLAVTAMAGVMSACSAITFGIANAPAAFGPFERKADIPYGANARQKLDVYVPKAAASDDAGMPGAVSGTSPASAGSPAWRPGGIFWYGGCA